MSDFGADVISIDAPKIPELDGSDLFNRGKRSLLVDIHHPAGVEVVARLSDQADVFIEGSRPGAMERRGLGPEVLLARNPRLIYLRLKGFGQSGPYAAQAGHDINYIAVGGALGVIGTSDEPIPPLNLVGDVASGSMSALTGALLALLERSRSDGDRWSMRPWSMLRQL